ncbi:hypothetical protein F4802DRAFT_389691 [Xylaria palmicola]|nr:hypothetical protein F4802DRAFT_389691 [Xylaria palmicola]
MSTPGSWLHSCYSKFKSLRTPTHPSKSTRDINRVLHGRVTKPVYIQGAAGIKGHKDAVEDSEDEKIKEVEEDSRCDSSSEITPDAELTDEIDCKEYNNDDEEDQDVSAIGLQLAMTAQHSDYEDSEPDPDGAWRWEQVYLNTILNARNEFTLMPLTWRMHFRGIPLPDSLFYIKTKSRSIRPRIYARTDRLEYRGALALRKLIDVHSRIQDIRSKEAAVKDDQKKDNIQKRDTVKALSADMAKQLRRALEIALNWAKQDGGVDKYADLIPPNVRIMELQGISATDEPESEVIIQTEMCRLAEEWRSHALDGDARVQAPVLFGFVIMKHIITIVTLDAADGEAVIHVPCQLHMAERNHYQWNALAIFVTICWARDVLLDYISTRPDIEPEVKSESSDPDA